MNHLIKVLIQYSEAQNEFLIHSESQKQPLAVSLTALCRKKEGHSSQWISKVVVHLLGPAPMGVWVGGGHRAVLSEEVTFKSPIQTPLPTRRPLIID